MRILGLWRSRSRNKPAARTLSRRLVGASVRVGPDGRPVFAVEGGSAAAAAGLQAGDLISQIDGAPMSGLDGLATALAGEGQRALSVARGGAPVEVILP